MESTRGVGMLDFEARYFLRQFPGWHPMTTPAISMSWFYYATRRFSYVWTSGIVLLLDWRERVDFAFLYYIIYIFYIFK